jgi:hypothetical protein
MVKKILAILGGAALLAAEIVAVDAANAEIRVRCERRGNSRSRVSVDGNNVSVGTYYVKVTSGSNSVGPVSTSVPAGLDQFEVDFDSNRADILAGAIKISKTFIQAGQVSVQVTNPNGTSSSVNNVACRIR